MVYRLTDLSGLYFHVVILRRDGGAEIVPRASVVLISPDKETGVINVIKGIERNHPHALLITSPVALLGNFRVFNAE